MLCLPTAERVEPWQYNQNERSPCLTGTLFYPSGSMDRERHSKSGPGRQYSPVARLAHDASVAVMDAVWCNLGVFQTLVRQGDETLQGPSAIRYDRGQAVLAYQRP